MLLLHTSSAVFFCVTHCLALDYAEDENYENDLSIVSLIGLFHGDVLQLGLHGDTHHFYRFELYSRASSKCC